MNGKDRGPHAEPGIGRRLRQAREELGISPRQVEQETKIRAGYLLELERENFDVLPFVYVVGSLKTYADYLGLDGASLAGELKRLRTSEAEEDAARGGSPSSLTDTSGPWAAEDDGAPLVAAGFDRLFLGMGTVLIVTLAVMTLVPLLARGDQLAVSRMQEPILPEAPSETALAGNFTDEPELQPLREKDASNPGIERDDGRGANENRDEPSESGRDANDRGEQAVQDAQRAAPVFEGVEVVPMPVSPPPTTGATPSAIASITSSATASAIASATASVPPTTSTPVPSTPASAAPASPTPAQAGTQTPAAPVAEQDPSPAAPPAREDFRGRGVQPERVPGVKKISAEVSERIDEAFEDNGLDR